MRPNMAATVAALAIASVLAACTSQAPTAGASAASANANACLRVTDIQEQNIVSDQEIRFKLRNGDTWANTLPRACPGLKLSGGFSWEVHGLQVCSNKERITVKDTGTPCLIGEFARLPATATAS